MKKKIIFILVLLTFILLALGGWWLFKDKEKDDSEEGDYVQSDFENLEEYRNSIDYNCDNDSDCEIKDVHNCCGYYPECVNRQAMVDAAFVRDACNEEGKASICGFTSIDTCRCINSRCEGYLKNENI